MNEQESGMVSLVRRAGWYVVAAAAAVLYYAFFAPGIMAVLSLMIPAQTAASVEIVAAGWGLAEAVTVALPFAALALLVWVFPTVLPRDIWLAPLAVVVLPTALSALWNLYALGSLHSAFSLDSGLVSELAVAIDLVAALLGSALVIVVRTYPQQRVGYAPKAAHR